MIRTADQAWKESDFAKAVQFYQAVNMDHNFFYSLFMETIGHIILIDIPSYKKNYQRLLSLYRDNQYLSELEAYLRLKQDSRPDVVSCWTHLLERFPQSKKLSKALQSIKTDVDFDLLQRHAQVLDIVTFPPKSFQAARYQDPTVEVGKKKAIILDDNPFYRSPGMRIVQIIQVAGAIVAILSVIRILQILLSEGGSGLESRVRNIWTMLNQKMVTVSSNRVQVPDVKKHTISEKKNLEDSADNILLYPEKFRHGISSSMITRLLERSRQLLRDGYRNQSLLLLNHTLSRPISIEDENRLLFFLNVAKVALPDGAVDKSPAIDVQKIFQNPSWYQFCQISWQGRLDRVFQNQREGSYLQVAIGGVPVLLRSLERVSNMSVGKQIQFTGTIRREVPSFASSFLYSIQVESLSFANVSADQ